jgi:hypothetical protein
VIFVQRLHPSKLIIRNVFFAVCQREKKNGQEQGNVWLVNEKLVLQTTLWLASGPDRLWIEANKQKSLIATKQY